MHAYTTRRYALREEAGFAIRYMAPKQKLAAPILGIAQSNVSRQVNGEQDGDVSDFYALVERAVLDPSGDAGALIQGAMLRAECAAITLPVDEVRRRWFHACAQETIEQSAEDVATQRAIVAVAEGSPDERFALEAQDDALRREGARHVDALIYNRAYRVLRGWRAAP